MQGEKRKKQVENNPCNEISIPKGQTNCRCECCVYWRRHVQRIGRNKDRVISKLTKKNKLLGEKICGWKWSDEKLGRKLKGSEATTRLVRKELKKSKDKLKKLQGKFTCSIFSWPF